MSSHKYKINNKNFDNIQSTDVIVTNNLQVNGLIYSTETLTSNGTASNNIPLTLIDSSAGSLKITLADGKSIGQQKQFIYIVKKNDVTITPETTAGTWKNFQFKSTDSDSVGQSINLVWTSVGWTVISRGGGVAVGLNSVNGLPVIN